MRAALLAHHPQGDCPKPERTNRLIMAGHEAMLAQWFHRPLKRGDIELARQWYATHSATRGLPARIWDAVLAEQPGDDITLPVDMWGFPGGQTFLAGVPCLVFEGPGGLVSYLEPAMCRYFAPVIQATKGAADEAGHAARRRVRPALRARSKCATSSCCSPATSAGRRRGVPQLTSNDTAEFLYPELFRRSAPSATR